MAVTIKLRRDTASNWGSNNPTLAEGEPGFETDTGKIKYGDGTTAWNSLAYAVAGPQGEQGPAGADSTVPGPQGEQGIQGEQGPAGPSGSGSGSGNANIEWFKLNYDSAGALDSITDTTSGLSATIVSTTGGDVEITFSGYSYPPASILIYGYAHASNEYVVQPFNKDFGMRKLAGGGSQGSPTAHGAMGSLALTLKLREAETASSRSFGTTTHAWIHFVIYG